MKIDYDHKTTAWDDIRRWLKAMLNEAKSFLLLLFSSVAYLDYWLTFSANFLCSCLTALWRHLSKGELDEVISV